MPFNSQHLSTLGLQPADLEGLSLAEQKTKLRRTYYALSAQLHPDKNPGDNAAVERFKQVAFAYAHVEESEQARSLGLSINGYYQPQKIDISMTAIDLAMLDNIEESYADLRKQFNQLETEAEKRAFAKHYQNFFNLAESLEAMRDSLIQQQGEIQYAYTSAQFSERYKLRWRHLMISLFAEEYLDDFAYRHAMATGDLYPILATRKLVSPIKFLVARINAVFIFLLEAASYFSSKIVLNLLSDFLQLLQKPTLDYTQAVILGLKILGFASLVILPFYITPTLVFAAIGLPIIVRILNAIASPVNTLLRPLAQQLGISLTASLVLASLATAVGLYGLVAATSLVGFTALITIANLSLNLYSSYAIAKMIYLMYKLNPILAQFQIALMIPVLGLSLLLPPDDYSQPLNALALLIANLANVSILYTANEQLANNKQVTDELTDMLPLPAEPVPEEVKQATLLGNKRAWYSHSLFNTPKDAEVIPAEERTYAQCCASFFGGGMRTAKKPVFAAVSEMPTLLLQSA